MPDRISWALDLLDVQPTDHVLEVGCGTGVALALVADRLDGGTVLGIDRSATATAKASVRLAEVPADRWSLQQTDLAGLEVEPASFDRAFAVNVNVFWTRPASAECEVLARALRPGGRLVLAYAGPDGEGTRDIAPGIAAKLEAHGFDAEVVEHPSGSMVAVTAHRRPG